MPSQIIITLPVPEAGGLEPASGAEFAGLMDGGGELGHGLEGGGWDGADEGIDDDGDAGGAEADVAGVQIANKPGFVFCPEEVNRHAEGAGGAHSPHHTDGDEGVRSEVFVHLAVGLLGDEKVSGVAEADDFGGAGTGFVQEAEFLDGIEQCGVHLRELEREVVLAVELELLPEGTIGAEVEELVNAAGVGIQPGAGFLAFVQALQLPGVEGAELIEIKAEPVERD